MKIILGSAQFGMNYGVANNKGKVCESELISILDFAAENNIKFIDTAPVYGSSECALQQSGRTSAFRIGTKIPKLESGIEDIEKHVFDSIERSLIDLGVDKLFYVLVHDPIDLTGPNGLKMISTLSKLKNSGLSCKIGVSIYSPQILDSILEKFKPDIVQCPYNLFDQRLVQSGWLSTLKKEAIEVHSRSIFLQGLLLTNDETRPNYFNKWNFLFDRLKRIADKYNTSPKNLAFNFCFSEKSIDKLVIGVDNKRQLQEIVSLNGSATDLPLDECLELSCEDLKLIEPFNWGVKN